MNNLVKLTAEQVSLLIMLKDLEDFSKKQPDNIPVGGYQEVLVSNGIFDANQYSKYEDALIEFGYLTEDEEITVAGNQYLELFQEYIESETEKKTEKANRFSLISIDDLEINISLFSLKISLGDDTIISKLMKYFMH